MELDSDIVSLDKDLSEAMLRNIEGWDRPTFTQVRQRVLDREIIVPLMEDGEERDKEIFSALPEMYYQTVAAGRAFDLGHLPNEMIVREAKRAGVLLHGNHIDHPFSNAYVLYHTWEGGGSLLLVDPSDWHASTSGRLPPRTFAVAEIQPVTVLGRPLLMMADLGYVAPQSSTGYTGIIIRSALSQLVEKVASNVETLAHLAAPVMAALLLLATDGVAVERIEASVKLNKARAKSRKPAIPPHWRVATADYITAITPRQRQRDGEGGGGHHASPIPHLRRGHLRKLSEYHGGGERWIRDSLVNLKDPDAPLARSFYAMRQAEQR